MSIHPIHHKNESPAHMTAVTWQHRLDHARTADEVVAVARDFLASFEPAELQSLPESCRPVAKVFEDDIASYAFDLMRHESGPTEPGELVHKLARFFSHASMRLAQLTARDQAGDLVTKQSA
jgi:hypothetical protein